jgi:thymidylate synthase (FAD)
MRVIKPLVVVETPIETEHWLKKLEYFTRKCYKSEGKATETSYKEFVRRVFRTMKHEGVIEHFSVSVTMITDRGVSHENVRHRLAAYLQESTRYVDYSGKGVTFILPPWVSQYDPPGSEPPQDISWLRDQEWREFIKDCKSDEIRYDKWRNNFNWKPQQARYFLPNGIKTEYVATLNLRSWYNFFRLRTPANAHPQIRQLAIPLLAYFREKLPDIFDGFEIPQFEYEPAKLIEHFGYEQLDDIFEEVYTDK